VITGLYPVPGIAGVLIERVAQHGGYGKDGMAIDDTLMEHVTDLAHPVVDIHLGTAQAQGGFTAHGNEMFALATIQASIFNVSDLLRVATPEHLFHQTIIVATIITEMPLFEFIPVVDKYLFKDIPSWSEF